MSYTLAESTRFLGLGRTGSWAAALAVRNGFRHISAYDHDSAEIQQYINCCFRGDNEKRARKIDCVGRYLTDINPDIIYRGYPIKIDNSNLRRITDKLINEEDIIIVAIDDYEILPKLFKRLCPHIPVIFGRLFENAFLSDCCYSLPGGRSACVSCCIGKANKQLRGGQGLPLDIIQLPSLMIRIALGIVHIGTKYNDHYQPYFKSDHNYFFLTSQPTDMFPLSTTTPSFIRMIEVRKRCSNCRGEKGRKR